MSYNTVREIDPEVYQDQELIDGFASLEEFRVKRAEIALLAARHIIGYDQGEILDLRLYYAAMFGRSYDEGISEHDPNLLVPLGIARSLEDPELEGQPLLIRAVNYPDQNVDVGVVASFSEDSFEPFKFVVKMGQVDGQPEDFSSWEGALLIAMRKVEPLRSEDGDYKLSDEVTPMEVCETSTWISHDGSLEIHPVGTGGIEVGESVHLNSEHGKKYSDRLAFWLRQHLAPTEPRPFSNDLRDMQTTMRRFRIESAREQGISEAQAAAQGLSPTIEAFFGTLKPYAEDEELYPIDTQAAFQAWHDPYDAQSLLTEVQVRDLVEVGVDGRVYVTVLGRETLSYIDRQ